MTTDYKKLVEEYCIFGYKWNSKVKNHILKPYRKTKQFYKIIKPNTLDIIEVNVIYSYFKIITLTRLVLSEKINLFQSTPEIIMQILMDNKDIKTNDTNLENGHRFKYIKYRYKIKICENNDVLTILDDLYNNYKISDKINSDIDNVEMGQKDILNTDTLQKDTLQKDMLNTSAITISELVSSILEIHK